MRCQGVREVDDYHAGTSFCLDTHALNFIAGLSNGHFATNSIRITVFARDSLSRAIGQAASDATTRPTAGPLRHNVAASRVDPGAGGNRLFLPRSSPMPLVVIVPAVFVVKLVAEAAIWSYFMGR